MQRVHTLLVLVLLAPCACGGGGGSDPGVPLVGSCALSSVFECNEYFNPQVDLVRSVLQPICVGMSGSWSNAACPTANRVGSCRDAAQQDGSYQINRYYTGIDPIAQASSCTQGGGTWTPN